MPKNGLVDAWHPERFRQEGHRLVDALAEHLRATHEGNIPAYPGIGAEEMLRQWPSQFDPNGSHQFEDLVSRYLAGSTQLHSPNYVGHQVATPAPVFALAHLVSAFANQSGAVYEMSPSATAIERHVVAWMAACLGFGPDADGFLVNGGAIGNLTSLLAARTAMRHGFPEAQPAVLVSEQAHYCVARAAEILGLDRRAVISVPVDRYHRMNVDGLKACKRQAEADGFAVMAVAASACSTSAGAYDPIEAIADFCETHRLWMHVDGAHGASAVLSSKYRELAAGIERADSVVWDIHKMMLAPALATGVFFRRGKEALAGLSQKAAYLLDEGNARFDGAQRSIECTRPALAVPIYLALNTLGTDVFGEFVTTMYDRARWFAGLLNRTDEFEVAVPPESNIVCFRYAPFRDPASNNDLQRRIREALLDDGEFYIVQTELNGTVFLRTTLMNPLTTEEVLRKLVARISLLGQARCGHET